MKDSFGARVRARMEQDRVSYAEAVRRIRSDDANSGPPVFVRRTPAPIVDRSIVGRVYRETTRLGTGRIRRVADVAPGRVVFVDVETEKEKLELPLTTLARDYEHLRGIGPDDKVWPIKIVQVDIRVQNVATGVKMQIDKIVGGRVFLRPLGTPVGEMATTWVSGADLPREYVGFGWR